MSFLPLPSYTPGSFLEKAAFGSFVDVWSELLLEAVLRLRERRVWVRRIQTDLTYKIISLPLCFCIHFVLVG